jgi:hypothetical protein
MVDFTLKSACPSRKSGPRRGLEGRGVPRGESWGGRDEENSQPINCHGYCGSRPNSSSRSISRPRRRLARFRVLSELSARFVGKCAVQSRPERAPPVPKMSRHAVARFSLLLGGHWSGGASTMQRRRLSLIHVLMRWIRSPTISIWSTASSVITTGAHWIFDHDH